MALKSRKMLDAKAYAVKAAAVVILEHRKML